MRPIPANVKILNVVVLDTGVSIVNSFWVNMVVRLVVPAVVAGVVIYFVARRSRP